MASVKTTLDTRRIKSDGTYNIIYRISHKSKVYTINSGVSIREYYWDYDKLEVNKQHPNYKLLNLKVLKGYFDIEKAILTLESDFSIDSLRRIVKGEPLKPSIYFGNYSTDLIEQLFNSRNTGNAIVYRTAMNRFLDFCGKDIMLDAIDYQLLEKFRDHLKATGLKPNSISNYFRTIRAIYNKAIKSKLVDRSNYPFYDISMKTERTVKRAISKADIVALNNLPLEVDSAPWRALKYFILSFYLRGISFTDMAYLKPSDIIRGRIHYKRRKTHKLYSMKLFSPAKELLDYWKDENRSYLLPILPNNTVEDSLEAKRSIKQWIKTTNKYLKRLSQEIGSEIPITTYSSRHSFASIAKKLGYSNEMIAESLGHEYGNKITNIYLDEFDVEVLDKMHFDVISIK